MLGETAAPLRVLDRGGRDDHPHGPARAAREERLHGRRGGRQRRSGGRARANEEPDVAILDLRMPRARRHRGGAPHLRGATDPIVMLTAFSDRANIEKAIGAGVFSYLVKPFRETDIVPAVRAAVRATRSCWRAPHAAETPLRRSSSAFLRRAGAAGRCGSRGGTTER